MNESTRTPTPVASLLDVSKSFDETQAVSAATVHFYAGQVLGLVGANGSGKTTLMNLLCGNLIPDRGTIRVRGNEVQFRHTSDAIAHGIRMLTQSTEIYPDLRVLENIFIGQEIVRSVPFPRLMRWKAMRSRARDLLACVGAETIRTDSLAGVLSGGQKKAVALARLLATEADLLVFDEPVAALGVQQKDRLLRIVANQAADGKSVVFISHDVADVMSVADRILILRSGRAVFDTPRSDVTPEYLATEMAISHHDDSTAHGVTTGRPL